MELYIIRHAESLNNANPVELRVEDPPLTELGRWQAERLAKRMQHLGLTRLFVSPFRRALETILPIRHVTDLVPEVWIDLHEQGGVMSGIDADSYAGRPGLARAEILDLLPEAILPEEIDHQGWWKCRPFEEVEEALQRAHRVARQVRERFAHAEERVALVSHGAFMSLLISAFVGLPDRGHDWFEDITNTAITKLTIMPAYTQFGLLNCVRHLPDEWVTGGDLRHFREREG